MTTTEPFHERFKSETSSKQPSPLRFFPMLFDSLLKLVSFQKSRKDWPASYFLIVNTIKVYMDQLVERPRPDVLAIQASHSKVGNPPPNAVIIPAKVQTRQNVIDFLKTANIAEWPEPASVIVDVPAEFQCDPSAKDCDRVVLFLHGGAYVMGCAEHFRPNNIKISKTAGAKIFGVNYRLAPQNPFPCGLIDAVSAYLYLLETYTPENIAVMGDSAGGGLTLATLQCIRDMGLPSPAAGYCQSPWCDLTHSFPSFSNPKAIDYLPAKKASDERLFDRSQYYVSDLDLKHPYASPYWSDNLKGLPTLLIQLGTAERLHDEIVAFSKNYASASTNGIHVELYEYHVHTFQLFRVFDASKKAIVNAGEFLGRVFDRKASKQNEYTIFNFSGEKVTSGDLEFLESEIHTKE